MPLLPAAGGDPRAAEWVGVNGSASVAPPTKPPPTKPFSRCFLYCTAGGGGGPRAARHPRWWLRWGDWARPAPPPPLAPIRLPFRAWAAGGPAASSLCPGTLGRCAVALFRRRDSTPAGPASESRLAMYYDHADLRAAVKARRVCAIFGSGIEMDRPTRWRTVAPNRPVSAGAAARVTRRDSAAAAPGPTIMSPSPSRRQSGTEPPSSCRLRVPPRLSAGAGRAGRRRQVACHHRRPSARAAGYLSQV